MNWIATTLQWYFYLLLLGTIFWPLTRKIFGRTFIDEGYGLAKIIGTLFLTYAMFVLGTIQLFSFSRLSLFILIAIFALINYQLIDKSRASLLSHLKNTRLVFVTIFEEGLFFASLFFWTFVRGHEPSIHGLEKFMDYGFINSILRSDYFPPRDMWLAGHSINYYYFGHMWGAVLTRLTNIPSSISYNLILATIFALSIVATLSLISSLTYKLFVRRRLVSAMIAGILGTFIVNFGGNLHTIYAFTSGYEADKPVPFWGILSHFTPEKYWYPNATRFIPFTIHEFPIYSYVVADLHGHVFDIPFVLLTLSLLLTMFIKSTSNNKPLEQKNSKQFPISALFLGFLCAIHYMTNAFDGPIYLLLCLAIFLLIYKFTVRFFINAVTLIMAFIVFGLPFTLYFNPFAKNIGVNCAPEALVRLGHWGPFLFEKGNCQISPLWMLATLWGFFIFNFLFFIIYLYKEINNPAGKPRLTDLFILVLFSFGTFLITVPEFFYLKDIYPAHFRANTMFKLGYQAFMMMGIASTYTFFIIKNRLSFKRWWTVAYFAVFAVLFFLIAIYPTFAIPSYYGKLNGPPQLDGTLWVNNVYPEYKEIINYLNMRAGNESIILEAQGDSYTDFNVVSSYTGLPTVAGWWVHEWLWRGSSEVVGNLAPQIQSVYESGDADKVRSFLIQYNIRYIIVGSNERKKYLQINEEPFKKMGKVIFVSSDGQGKIYEFQ